MPLLLRFINLPFLIDTAVYQFFGDSLLIVIMLKQEFKHPIQLIDHLHTSLDFYFLATRYHLSRRKKASKLIDIFIFYTQKINQVYIFKLNTFFDQNSMHLISYVVLKLN